MKLRNKKTGEITPPINMFMSVDLLSRYNTLKEFTDEWEDYEEPKLFYVIDLDGEILPSDFEDKTTKKSKELGNYFETKEEALATVEKLKAWKRLRDKGFKLDAVVDSFFCLDIYMKGKPYEEIKEDLKIVFGGKE